MLRDAERVEDLDGGAHAAVLSDSLLSAWELENLRALKEHELGVSLEYDRDVAEKPRFDG